MQKRGLPLEQKNLLDLLHPLSHPGGTPVGLNRLCKGEKFCSTWARFQDVSSLPAFRKQKIVKHIILKYYIYILIYIYINILTSSFCSSSLLLTPSTKQPQAFQAQRPSPEVPSCGVKKRLDVPSSFASLFGLPSAERRASKHRRPKWPKWWLMCLIFISPKDPGGLFFEITWPGQIIWCGGKKLDVW